MMAATKDEIKGGWVGIDLGTSNCSAAVWDLSRSRCKVLRLGYQNLARRTPTDVSKRKGGKIVPSAVLFCQDASERRADNSHNNVDNLPPSIVGYAAIQSANATDGGENSDERTCTRALVTSFKRVVGMSSKQAKELQSNDPEFWNSLPFHAVVADWNGDNTETGGNNSQPHNVSQNQALSEGFFDVLGDASSTQEQAPDEYQTSSGMNEGVAIKIHPLPSNDSGTSSEILVRPLQVTTILLRAIRAAAFEYLSNNRKSKIQAPGLQEGSPEVQNCVIGVPVHYSQAQRSAIQNAAKNAGFQGHVSVLTESTAAAMAYGLFVSPNKSLPSINDISNNVKNILVFDMGGGTTDVTIASIQFGNAEKVEFRVLATAGDRCLGGDNVDELLARFLWKRPELCAISAGDEANIWKATDHHELIGECRRAKEDLCGSFEDDDNTDSGKQITKTHVTLHGKATVLTRDELDTAIQPLVDRAEHVVDDALSILEVHEGSPLIHEVILVGGSTHIPTIRSMLRRRFPPPIPPELCTSISAETAVAQGLAIQAALLSGLVPLWELRNAMMLDVLPHTIGVWVFNGWDAEKGAPFSKGQIIQPQNNGQCQGYFVPILLKDSTLPSMGSATFTLASANQSGVTIIAAEQIGPGSEFQCMGVFDFLLHRLTKANRAYSNVREVKVGMTLETSGEFIVSIFDANDPVHREKRRRYLMEKALSDRGDDVIPKDCMDHYLYEEEDHSNSFTRIEITLASLCAILFVFYVATRLAFGEIEPLASDEL